MIVKGVLEKMSSGDEQSGTVVREYITVNGKRIRRVYSTSFMDEILKESIGEEISLSLKKGILGKKIMAFKNADGEINKFPISHIITFTVLKLIGLAAFAGMTVLTLFQFTKINHTIILLLSLLLLTVPFILMINEFKIRNELS